MLKEAFGDNTLDLTQTYEWFTRFKKGRMSLDDDERSGRPSTGATTKKCGKSARGYPGRRTIQHNDLGGLMV
jgi:hypothetical protein